MDRVRIVTHRGARIVFQDFSSVQTPEEGMRAIEEARAFVEQQPKGVLLLTDVTGSTFDQRVVYATVVKITGRVIRPFTSSEEAMDWLVSQPR